MFRLLCELKYLIPCILQSLWGREYLFLIFLHNIIIHLNNKKPKKQKSRHFSSTFFLSDLIMSLGPPVLVFFLFSLPFFLANRPFGFTSSLVTDIFYFSGCYPFLKLSSYSFCRRENTKKKIPET